MSSFQIFKRPRPLCRLIALQTSAAATFTHISHSRNAVKAASQVEGGARRKYAISSLEHLQHLRPKTLKESYSDIFRFLLRHIAALCPGGTFIPQGLLEKESRSLTI